MIKPANVSSCTIFFKNKVFYANDGAYLIGFPKKQTVEAII